MAFEHENTIYGSYGEFEPVSDDVDWAEHDEQSREYFEMQQAEWEAEQQMAFYDDDPSPYDGTYSEM